MTNKDLKLLDIHSLEYLGTIKGNDKITCINGIFVKVKDLKKLIKRRK